eukprot:g40101.t1
MCTSRRFASAKSLIPLASVIDLSMIINEGFRHHEQRIQRITILIDLARAVQMKITFAHILTKMGRTPCSGCALDSKNEKEVDQRVTKWDVSFFASLLQLIEHRLIASVCLKRPRIEELRKATLLSCRIVCFRALQILKYETDRTMKPQDVTGAASH